MPLRTGDLILSSRHADPEIVLARLDRPDERDRAFVFAVVRYCRVAGVDPVLTLIQWLLETGNATSERWKRDLNSSGIGIVGEDTQQPFRIPSIDGAAALHVQCLYSLVTRTLSPQVPLFHEANDWMERVWLPKVTSLAMPEVRTVHDLGLRYVENGRPRATWSWEDGKVKEATYGKKLTSRALQFYPEAPDQEPAGATVEQGRDESMALTFGRVPMVPHKVQLVCKPVHNDSAYGYDFVPNGRRPIVGMAWHEWMDGGAPGSRQQFYEDFFACSSTTCFGGEHTASGERCRNALVDGFIMRDGTLVIINDIRGKRRPWASGGSGPYAGDGPAFVRTFGVTAVNERLMSIEIVKASGEAWTAAQIQTAGRLAARTHDQDGQRWDEHPYTSRHGCVTSIAHFEVGNSSCMSQPHDLAGIAAVQAVTRQVMRQYQEAIPVPDPLPPHVEPFPLPALPGGLTVEQAAERFGEAVRHELDGSTRSGFGFDPNGPISMSWMHRAAADQTWPQIEDWYVLEDSGKTLQLVTFSNDWRLVQVAERAGWNWMDMQTVEIAA
ncbi:MAG: hypothetical protein AB7G88_08045 [Thermomicrobiales bacterium]